MNTTEQWLIDRYGPLMTLQDLATVFNRSADGLRLALYGQSELAQQLHLARRKIGRRVYFRTAAIALLVDGQPSEAG